MLATIRVLTVAQFFVFIAGCSGFSGPLPPKRSLGTYSVSNCIPGETCPDPVVKASPPPPDSVDNWTAVSEFFRDAGDYNDPAYAQAVPVSATDLESRVGLAYSPVDNFDGSITLDDGSTIGAPPMLPAPYTGQLQTDEYMRYGQPTATDVGPGIGTDEDVLSSPDMPNNCYDLDCRWTQSASWSYSTSTGPYFARNSRAGFAGMDAKVVLPCAAGWFRQWKTRPENRDGGYIYLGGFGPGDAVDAGLLYSNNLGNDYYGHPGHDDYALYMATTTASADGKKIHTASNGERFTCGQTIKLHFITESPTSVLLIGYGKTLRSPGIVESVAVRGAVKTWTRSGAGEYMKRMISIAQEPNATPYCYNGSFFGYNNSFKYTFGSSPIRPGDGARIEWKSSQLLSFNGLNWTTSDWSYNLDTAQPSYYSKTVNGQPANVYSGSASSSGHPRWGISSAGPAGLVEDEAANVWCHP